MRGRLRVALRPVAPPVPSPLRAGRAAIRQPSRSALAPQRPRQDPAGSARGSPAGAGALMAIRSTSRGRILEMDGLRALAIGAVMIEHFAGGPIRHVLPWGAFGVQPFFALSGFL